MTIAFRNVKKWLPLRIIGSAIEDIIATIAACRTTAEFLFACGIQLLTLSVLLSRALINT
jgi:hypothetical protein